MIQQVGDVGVCLYDGNVISYRVGDGTDLSDSGRASRPKSLNQLLGLKDYSILMRGEDNREVERMQEDIANNRLMPSLIRKQVQFLYGKGPRIYIEDGVSDEATRKWVDEPTIKDWLEGWESRGIAADYKEFARTIIKNFYFFRDYFIRWRYSIAPGVAGTREIAGLEALDNRYCRLATKRKPTDMGPLEYRDMKYVAYGDFEQSIGGFDFFPLFRPYEMPNSGGSIGHYREPSPGCLYGLNEVYHGIGIHLRLSNDLPEFIRSFLDNSLAAKVHVVIPNAWMASKRTQLEQLCEENKRREQENIPLIAYEGIVLGTEYSESTLVKYVQNELRKLSSYLSGAKNQGKAFSSFSFFDGTTEQRWRIETIDLKYKEYIDALTAVDRRVDEVLLSSTGLDSSITAISKPGMISKSGSDTYYNYVLYVLSLSGDDEICAKPFNQAIAINFPELYKEGYRIGYYRPLPSRQEDVSPHDRLNNQKQ